MIQENSLSRRSIMTAPSAVILLLCIVCLAALLVWLGPDEKTLGAGIKAVYVHVSLTWAGLAGFIVAGVLGVGTMIWQRHDVDRWRQTVGWVAFGFYLAGVAMSILASKINWGAVFWREPRMATSFNVLAVALVFLTANLLMPWRWLRGLLSALLPVLIIWANMRAALVLHPGNAVRASTAASIQLTFLAMFVLALAVEGILIWLTHHR